MLAQRNLGTSIAKNYSDNAPDGDGTGTALGNFYAENYSDLSSALPWKNLSNEESRICVRHMDVYSEKQQGFRNNNLFQTCVNFRFHGMGGKSRMDLKKRETAIRKFQPRRGRFFCIKLVNLIEIPILTLNSVHA